MSTNRLIRSLPFWVLVGGSVVAIAGGAYLLISKLTTMATMLTDGTATGVEVYVGQIWAVLGAILVGVGLIGLALALTLGALGSFAKPAAVEVAEPVAYAEPAVETSAGHAAAGVESPAPATPATGASTTETPRA
ncbi:dinucleotide-utilizing enzyme [Microbacterium lacticum]